MNPGTYTGLRVVEKKFQKWVCFDRNRLFLLVPRSLLSREGGGLRARSGSRSTQKDLPAASREKKTPQEFQPESREEGWRAAPCGRERQRGGRSLGAFMTENRTAFSRGPGKRPLLFPVFRPRWSFCPAKVRKTQPEINCEVRKPKAASDVLRSERQPI